MKIAFDAKRVYQNETGLGNYSRTLISSLAKSYPQNDYYLCAPRLTTLFDITNYSNIENIVPKDLFASKLKSVWRSSWVKKDLLKKGIDLYHGLSHEIPEGINRTGIRSVVTIHDLIFERFPKQYNWLDIQIYRHKFKYACKNADHIIAISRQTKDDIINFYNVPDEKITICYQSCDPVFGKRIDEDERKRIKQLYKLPEQFFLSIGSIIERKNLLGVCKALSMLKGKIDTPLVVIGNGGKYKQRVKAFIGQKKLEKQVFFLSETEVAKNTDTFRSSTDLPAIYQLSSGIIYPSFFEGFGIPVLEALWSRVPVITSNVSCLPEAGGDAAYYVNPSSPEEIAAGMMTLAGDQTLVNAMKEKGLIHAQKFTPEKCAASVMEVYLRL